MPDLDRPSRFTEWVQWRKLFDRDARLARLTDKSFSKQLAEKQLGRDAIIPTLWLGKVLPHDPPAPLPLIVKANHGCNQFVVVRCHADWQRARRVAPRWMRQCYGRWLDEWHYFAAEPAIIVEPFLGPSAGLLNDYKIYVFGGQAQMIQVHEGRGANHRWSQWDRGGHLLSRTVTDRELPSSVDRMITAAERLSSGRDFLRVDFYEIDDKPKFGEFCLYPGSGFDPFDPDEIDHQLGAMWARQLSRQSPASVEIGRYSGAIQLR